MLKEIPKWVISASFFLLVLLLAISLIKGDSFFIAGREWGFRGKPDVEIGEMKVRYQEKLFSNLKDGGVIPGSTGATYCGLSMVDDDSADGSCEISFDKINKEWVGTTGGGGGDNRCKATCFWIDLG